jgi:hypothetical protein
VCGVFVVIICFVLFVVIFSFVLFVVIFSFVLFVVLFYVAFAIEHKNIKQHNKIYKLKVKLCE